MKDKLISLHFPALGIDRSASYRNIPPYTTPDAYNVRPKETIAGRARGGQRPGLTKAFPDDLGGYIQMLAQVDTADDDPAFEWSDSFDRDSTGLGDDWSTATWIGDEPDAATLLDGVATNSDAAGAVAKALDFDPEQSYRSEIMIVPNEGAHCGTYQLYLMMNDTTPNASTGGLIAEITLSGSSGSYSGKLIDSNTSTEYAFASGSTGTAIPGWFSVIVDGDSVTCSWMGVTLLTQTVSAGAVATGSRVGFGMAPAADGDICMVDLFSVTGKPTEGSDKQGRRSYLVAAADDNLFVERVPGRMTQVEGVTLNADGRLLCAAQHMQKLYIAAPVPVIYDPKENTVTTWATTDGKGDVPQDCPLICCYRDRLVLAKEHLWYMSRQGDAYDFDYASADATLDAGRAVAGQNSDAGQIAENITALIPSGDDYLVFGAMNSLWVLKGDPAYDGRIDCLSKTVGIIDRFAWCLGPASEVYFLSRDGLYLLPPGTSGLPQSLSRERLPEELLNVDVRQYEVSLSWDLEARGVHIYLTSNGGPQRYHWYYDAVNGGFWKDNLWIYHDPFQAYPYRNNECVRMLLGCRDGYIREYDPICQTDDGTAIVSYVDIGPFRLSDDWGDGMLADLVSVMARDSGDVVWKLYVGNTAEDTLRGGADDTLGVNEFAYGVWAGAGLQRKSRPRAKGGSARLRLRNYENSAWSMETITARIRRFPIQRKL